MMKKLLFLLATLCFAACQQPQKQYFEASAEIDTIKKVYFPSFLSQDWIAFRSMYADSAKIADNTWDMGKFINNEQHIESEKALHASFTDMKIGDDASYQMIITDKGEKWVSVWFNFSAKTKEGVEVNLAVHESFRFVDDKIVFQSNFYDSLPVYLALTPADSVVKK